MISKFLPFTKNLSHITKNSFAGETKYKVVFLRHGESQWNKENRFTGWHDVQLSTKGIEEARAAGKLLKKEGYAFDVAFLSVLTRAIQTFNYCAEEMGASWLPVVKHWRLNERHYGGLQGLNKSETAAKHGEEKVKIWRRAYAIPPPILEKDDPRAPHFDVRYKDLPPHCLPLTESLKDTVARTIPFWYDYIVPAMKQGKNVVVVAHGNSLRALVKHIDNISDDDIIGVNIPTSVPLVYEFDENIDPVKNYYLGDPEELKKKMESVKNQGKAK